MTFEFKPAVRKNVPLLIGIAGPSGSGKTLSALKLAAGLSDNKPFALIDTERGRALHYADKFDFLHADLEPPFSPERYWQAITQAVAVKPPVIVIDSFSHEHAGEGGVLDMHEAELDRLAGQDYKKRDAMKFAAWIKPKQAHKRLITHLLQLPVHLIVCLRAEEKVDIAKENGKTVVRPKKTLAGHVGWIPIAGKDLPFELTISLVVTPDAPGVPHPIKLMDAHKPFVPLNAPLDEKVGQQLAAWAKGSNEPADAREARDGTVTASGATSERARAFLGSATVSTEPPASPPAESPTAADGPDPVAPTPPGDTTPEAEDHPPLSSASGFKAPRKVAEQAGETVIPSGKYGRQTIAQVAESLDGAEWFLAMLKANDSPTRDAVVTYAREFLPDVWATYEQSKLATA